MSRISKGSYRRYGKSSFQKDIGNVHGRRYKRSNNKVPKIFKTSKPKKSQSAKKVYRSSSPVTNTVNNNRSKKKKKKIKHKKSKNAKLGNIILCTIFIMCICCFI